MTAPPGGDKNNSAFIMAVTAFRLFLSHFEMLNLNIKIVYFD